MLRHKLHAEAMKRHRVAARAPELHNGLSLLSTCLLKIEYLYINGFLHDLMISIFSVPGYVYRMLHHKLHLLRHKLHFFVSACWLLSFLCLAMFLSFLR